MTRNAKSKNWIVDAILFCGLLLAFLADLTGLALHQWLGVGLAALAAYHLLAHQNWVRAVTSRFITGTSARARLCYVVDAFLMAALGLVLLTGVVMSTWLSLPLANAEAWRAWHIASSIASLLIVVLKIALHWRWIVTPFQRQARPVARPVPVSARQPAHVLAAADRRQFFRLVGVVGAAAVLPLATGIQALVEGQAAGDQVVAAQAAPSQSASTVLLTAALAQQQTTSPVASATATPVAAAQQKTALATCTVRCNNKCSYPGRCRRYVDSNKNGLCDLGECV